LHPPPSDDRRLTDLLTQLADSLSPTYRIERELGGGGMSRVFLAEEPRLGRRVVVKVLPEEMSLGIPGDRFEREIRLAASLQHPHLVPVLNAGSAGDVVYYVMPYIDTKVSLSIRDLFCMA
jgi:serine/threonine-protein kinase